MPKNMGTITKAPKMASRAPFDRLYTLAEIAALPTRQRNKYERSLMQYWDMLSIKETERNALKRAKVEGRAEGRAEGLEEGLAKGHVEGREEGLVEGRKEGLEEARQKAMQEKLASARSLKSLGLTDQQIAKSLGLTEDQVTNA